MKGVKVKSGTLALTVLILGVISIAAILIADMSRSVESHNTPAAGNRAVAQVPSAASQGKAPTGVPNKIDVVNRRHILGNASPKQVADYVEANMLTELGATGPVTRTLVRPVARADMPKLGLDCLPDNPANEEPPYVLVILKGDFDFSGLPGRGRGREMRNERYEYAVVVIDVWSALPVMIMGSQKGGELRKALNDPSLPIVPNYFPSECPPWSPGTLPHGAIIPSGDVGTPQPTVYQTVPPENTPVMPPPISTEVVNP